MPNHAVLSWNVTISQRIKNSSTMYYQYHQFTGVIVGSIQPKSWKVMACRHRSIPCSKSWPKLREPNPVWKSDLLRYRWYLCFFWVPWKMRISGVLKIQDPQQNHGFTKSWSSTATGWWLGVHPWPYETSVSVDIHWSWMAYSLLSFLALAASNITNIRYLVDMPMMSPVYHYYCWFIPWSSNNCWNPWRNRKIAVWHHPSAPRNPWWSPAGGNQTGQDRPESAATGPWANGPMGRWGWKLGKNTSFSKRGNGFTLLVMTNIANWKDPPFSSWVNPLFLWSFSIAMLNYQRVLRCFTKIIWCLREVATWGVF